MTPCGTHKSKAICSTNFFKVGDHNERIGKKHFFEIFGRSLINIIYAHAVILIFI